MYENRIKHLVELHHASDKHIDALERGGKFSDVDLNSLKKQRLQYKDEISRLERLQWVENNERVEFEEDR